MVWVKWDLFGNEIDEVGAELAMHRVLTFHRQVLAGLSCPAHRQEPWLMVRGSTVKDLTVTIQSCCTVLKDQADERIRRVSRRHE